VEAPAVEAKKQNMLIKYLIPVFFIEYKDRKNYYIPVYNTKRGFMFVFPQGIELVSFLEKESRLRGPAANLSLVKQFADEATTEQAESCSGEQSIFVTMCGVAASRNPDIFKRAANNENWQLREGAVIGLQKLGRENLDSLYAVFDSWENANLLEKRCIAATLCDPALIKNVEKADKILTILDEYMELIELEKNVKNESYKAFRKAMGYCISVVIAASPEKGKEFFESWMQSPSSEIRWILSENLKHDRLRKVDSQWVDSQIEALSDVE
jgi:hypothetical protein